MTTVPLPPTRPAPGRARPTRSPAAGATRPNPRPRSEPSVTVAEVPRGGLAAVLARPLTSYYLVLGSAGLLVLLGLVMVLSASSVTSYQASGNSYALFEKQLMWVAVGLPFAVIAARLPLPILRRLGLPLLLVATLGLFAVLVPGVGVSANGATRWLGVGSFTLQPSEIAKLGLALWGADMLVRKRRRLGELRHLLIPLVPAGGLVATLVMAEPDMGTTIVIVLLLAALLWVVGAPLRLFALMSAAVVVVGSALAVADPYRLARLTSFLHPFNDAQVGGYQAVQGIYALSDGGWWGRGLGSGAEKWGYLPNAHTDFIFAIIGEELGLVGTLLVICLFGVLGYAGIRIAQRTPDPFARLAAAAITAWLVGQAVVNMGAVVGILPITGIPLPLISFGGSALVPTLVAVGLLASFARTEKGAARPARTGNRRSRKAAARSAG